MIERRRMVGILVVWACLLPASARAQPAAARFEAAFGVRWIGGTSFGARDATETTPAGGQFVLFSTDTRLSGLGALEARVGVRLTRSAQVEAEGSYGRGDLRTAVRGDTEGAQGLVASDRITQYTIGGGLVWRIDRWQLARDVVPFVSAGAGYLRQLHAENVLVEDGGMYYVGGGLNYLLGAPADPQARAIGLRSDLRLVVRRGGIAFDRRGHPAPAVGASFFVRF